MSWADIALGNRSAQPAMVQDKTGKWVPAPSSNGLAQAYGNVGAAGEPPMASQPGVDPASQFSNWDVSSSAPPTFAPGQLAFNQGSYLDQVSGNYDTQRGANGMAAGWGFQNPADAQKFGGQVDNGNMTIGGTPDAPTVTIKNGQYAGMQYQYQRTPDGGFAPVGQGQQVQMGTSKYGQDVWMPLAIAATAAGGIYGAGAGAAGEAGAGVGAGTGAGQVAAGTAPEYIGVGSSAGSGAGGGFGAAEGVGLGVGDVAGAGAGAGGLGGAGGGESANAAAGQQAGGSIPGATQQAGGYMNSLGQWIPLAGAVVGAIGANRAAGQQADAANAATGLQRDIYNQNRADLAPWRQAGGQNLARLQYLMGEGDQGAPGGAGGGDYGSLMRDFSMQDYQQDPGYQFRMQQGEQAINRNALARGRYNSGSVLKSLQDFNSGLASQEYGNAFNRFQTQRGTRLNALQAGSGIGQSGVPQTAQLGQNFGQQAGSNMIGAGNANAAGTMGITNALAGGLGQYYNNQQSQQQLQQNQQWQDNMLNALRGNQYGNNTGYQAYSGGG